MNSNTKHGFTLVELLIVIVVIAILAAISIVAYNGVANRGRTSSAQTAAVGVDKKVEAYAVELGTYPGTYAALTGATNDKSYYVAPTANTLATTTLASAPTNPNTINFNVCGTAAAGAAANYAAITVVTGVVIKTWNFQTGAIDTQSQSAGAVSGNSPAGYTINCYPASS